jgi:hypothetical protein
MEESEAPAAAPGRALRAFLVSTWGGMEPEVGGFEPFPRLPIDPPKTFSTPICGRPDRPIAVTMALLFSVYFSPNLWQIRYFPNKMKNRLNLTGVAVVIAAAIWTLAAPLAKVSTIQAAQPSDREVGPSSGENRDQSAADAHAAALALLRKAREQLIDQSIEAQIKEVVTIGDRRFRAQGSYLQGPGMKIRLDYQIRVGDSVGTLLEVCDGQVLSTSTTIQRIPPQQDAGASVEIEKTPQNTRVTRRDVGQILEAASRGETVPRIQLMAELGLGGLPALLASLERSMTFDRASDQALENGRQFKVIQGRWNKESQQRWQAILGGRGEDLPIYVPDAVRVYFDSENLFPQRVLYLKQHPEKKSLRPMVALDFAQVKFNVNVSDADFDYEPPDGVNSEDVTNEYLKQLIPTAGRPTSQQSSNE